MGGRSNFEGFLFIVSLAGGDHGIDDAGEFVGYGDDAFGFAQAAFHPAAVLAHQIVAAAERMARQPEGVGQPVGDFAGLGFEHAAAGAERSETAKGRSLCPKGSAGGRWQMPHNASR